MKLKNMVKTILLSLLVASILIAAGCARKTNGDNADENVNLKWIMLGSAKQKDSDMVWKAVNEELAKIVPNTTVDIEIIPGSSFGEKWQLMSAASEQIDIAWSGYAISSFLGEVEKGAYLPLDDLIAKHASDIEKELPDWLLALGKVGGSIYAIPNYQMMATSPYGVHTIREYADKYMDIEAIQAKYKQWGTNPEVGKEFYALFEDYLKKLKDNDLLNKGVGVGTITGFVDKQTYDSTTLSGFSINTDTMKIEADALSDWKKLWYDIAADWYKKGYIRNDVLSENMDGIDEAEKGYILWGHGYFNKTSESSESIQKGFDTRVFGLGDKYYIKNNIPATMTTLGRTCINPERAIKVVELMHTEKGKDLYNLLVYGIEGKHYEKISDRRIKTFDYEAYATADSPYGLNKWAVGNTNNAYETQVDEEGQSEYIRSLDETAEILPCVGFKPDTMEITVELAQIKTVNEEYKTLNYGAFENYEEIYKEYVNKLKSAGVDKVIDELQKQLDEWLKNKGV